MKNIELYRTIEELVESRNEQSAPGKPSFAHDYCKRQIQKKKLIPFNPKSKMNRIMKNFDQLDTYVNVEQLFDIINAKVIDRKREKTLQTQTTIKCKSKQLIPLDSQPTIDKVRQKLGPYNSRRNLKQALQLNNYSVELEQESSINGLKKENNSPGGNYHEIEEVLEKKLSQTLNTQEKEWNHYENIGYEIPTKFQPDKTLRLTHREYREKIKEKQERAQLIHQVSTYLQIILEDHHRKKWGARKQPSVNEKEPKTPVKRGSMTLSQSCRSSLYKSCEKSEGLLEVKEYLGSTLPSSPREKQNGIESLTRKNSSSNVSFETSRKMKETFTFRNRNIKKGLLKKIGNFVEFVEAEEKQLKKEKGSVMAEIARMESRERHTGALSMPEDHEIRVLHNVVRLQR